MRAVRSIRLYLFLFLASFLTPCLYGELACTTNWNRIRVGMVTSLPFTADVTFTDWQISPNGSMKQHGLTLIAHIARDGTGRVAIRMPAGWASRRSLEAGDEATSWYTTVCNPLDQTTISLSNASAIVFKDEICGSSPGLMHYRGPGFQRPLLPSKIIVDDLGRKDFGGARASGFRWSNSSNNNPSEGKVIEQWLSEDMEIETAHTEIDSSNHSEARAVVTNIHRGEPPVDLFEIPSSLKDKVVTKDGCPTPRS